MMVEVKAKESYSYDGNRVKKGETIWCDKERADILVNKGWVELVNPPPMPPAPPARPVVGVGPLAKKAAESKAAAHEAQVAADVLKEQALTDEKAAEAERAKLTAEEAAKAAAALPGTVTTAEQARRDAVATEARAAEARAAEAKAAEAKAAAKAKKEE